MKKILLTGLRPTATEVGIRTWMSGFGIVRNVDMVRDGDPVTPVAIVEMEITDEQAFHIVSRISRYWHDRSLVSARLLSH